MENNVYVVIMAGGVGSRFWPLSREARPKQFLDILGTGKSFLRQTYERFLPIVPAENILVVTGEQYRSLVEEHIPELPPDNILAEPLGRNTAACIAYAAFRLRARDPEAIMVATPADHLITGESEFQKAIIDSVDFAREHDAIMTIGITPTRPDTGYGYIQVGSNLGGEIFKAKTFTEKPSVEVAQMFIDSGEFFWNSGLFVWRNSVILDALACHLGEIYSLFEGEAQHFGTSTEGDTVRRIYPETRNVSIDMGVIERAENVYVRRSSFGWSDVGTWGALYALSALDDEGNSMPRGAKAVDTRGTLVTAPEGKLVVVRGLEDYIVVDTSDILLVWPRADEQAIKAVVNELRFGGENS